MHYEHCPTCGSRARRFVKDDGSFSYLGLVSELESAYPAEIFTPLSKGELETIIVALLGSGVRNASDRLHAQWARHWAGLLE